MHELINLTGQMSDLTRWLLVGNYPGSARQSLTGRSDVHQVGVLCTNNADNAWLASSIFR